MPISQTNKHYRGLLGRPLLRRIGHRLDPNHPPFGYLGDSSSWRGRVEALRADEARRVGEGLKALAVDLGVVRPVTWPSDPVLTPREKYFCDLTWALARRHVPAFKHLDTPVSHSKAVAQDGREGAAPAIDTALLHSVEYYRRTIVKEANDAGIQLEQTELVKRVHGAIEQFAAQDRKSPQSRRSYRGSVPHLKTVERLLQQIDDAFDAALKGRGTAIQCEYVEHVCTTLDGLDQKPWL